MKISHLVGITALLAICIGLSLALFSPLLLPLYGEVNIPAFDANDVSAMSFWQTAAFARVFGALLLAFGIFIWTTRRFMETEAGRPLIAALSLGFFVVSLVALTQQIAFWETTTGILMVISFMALAIAYGYFGMRKSREA